MTGPLLDSEDTLRLSCGAEANPAPEITWLRIPSGDTELELVSQGRDLVLSPVTKEDRGQSSNGLNKKLHDLFQENITALPATTLVS